MLDTEEQRNLMHCNRSFSRESFNDVAQSLMSAFPDGHATYPEFVAHVQGYLEAPLKAGHLLDRLVLSRQTGDSSSSSFSALSPCPSLNVRFLMTMLSLALETEFLEDRARSLYIMLAVTSTTVNGDDDSSKSHPLSYDEIVQVIGWLSLSHQIPVEKHVIKGDTQYPVQSYVQGSPEDLLKEALAETHHAAPLSEEALVDVLLSNAVCAWGSCYGASR